MVTFHFVVYNITVLLIIAHFLDSAKEQEWNEVIYFGNYPFWLISSTIIIAFIIGGIVPVYLGNNIGNLFSIIVAIAGLLAAGYHIPMNKGGKSNVCNNTFSYWLMGILSAFCLILLTQVFYK